MIHAAFTEDPARGCAPGRGVHPDIFFASPRSAENADEGTSAQARRDKARARRICRDHCPFTAACFALAERNNEPAGIWGGVDMASEDERLQAVAHYGLGPVAPVKAEAPETDEVLVERVLKAGPGSFKALTDEQKALVIRAGRDRGLSWTQLERRFRANTGRLKALSGEEAETFDQQVFRAYHTGKADAAIALTLGCDPKQVYAARKRLNLPALFGPGGRLRRRVADSQKALVSA